MRETHSPMTWRIYAMLTGVFASIFILHCIALWIVFFFREKHPELGACVGSTLFAGVLGRFAWGLWFGERFMLVGLLGHCIIWLVPPIVWWSIVGGNFEIESLWCWFPILFYLPPVISGILHWREMNAKAS
jgi:hypothetical protein